MAHLHCPILLFPFATNGDLEIYLFINSPFFMFPLPDVSTLFLG
uniref:Uncharacterized protein n=1 Tax=Arundo donax TaxID=35708 RepID=A0A0A9FTC2_ARUDO